MTEGGQPEADPRHRLGRMAQAAMERSEESAQLIRLLLEATGHGLYGIDLDGRCTFANEACAQMLGVEDPRDLVGEDMHHLIHHTRPDGTAYPVEECQIHRAFREPRGVMSDEEVLFRRDGTSFPVEYRSHAVEADDMVIGAVVTFADITHQREARLRLHESEARFRSLFDAANTGMSMNTLDGRYAAANPSFCRMVGYSEAELVEMDFVQLTHPDDRGTNRALFEQLLAGDIPAYRIEKRYLRKDGRAIWVDLAVSLVRGEDGQPRHTVATMEDITEQRQARQALLDREARLAQQAALLDKARDAIVVRDLDQRITYWNRSAEELYGWTAAEVIGRPSRELHPDPAAFDEAIQELLASDEWHGELMLRHRSGSQLVVESRWTLVRDDAGNAQSVLVIDTDITERTHLEAQLLRAQRMESIGTLAGGLAHDLNNVLTPIMMSTGLLQLDETDEERRALLDTITASTSRAADMVRQILSFARGIEGRRLPVDIDVLMRDVQRIAEDTFLKTIRIVRHDTIDLWPVIGDPTQLHQVLINLCVNARDAMPHGGTLRLATDAVVVDEQYAALSHGVSPGPYVRILVEDDGQGMPPEVLDRIFEPFFTTKDQGRGTGLGLSISMGIITSHGGFIRVYSEPRRGTRFLIHLPAAVEAGTETRSPAIAAVPRGGGELILLIDDEEQIRKILGQTLEAFGYRVLRATDGADAVEVLAAHREEVDVVLTDMMMPGMDGPMTIRAMRRIRSDIPVIAASGLHSQGEVTRASELGVRHFLPKPCSISHLLQMLRDIIEEEGDRV